jgi:glycosyltransferase involved in cell wall biosynthesis
VLAARTWWDQLGVTEDGAHFCFVGSHTRSFDFGPLIDAAAALAKSHPSTRLVICGSGDQSAVWRAAAADLPNVLFPGWIDQAQYGALGGRCVGFIAPYKNLQGFELNIPNKIADALAMGLGVVTPLSGEVASLIAEYGAGMRYGEGSGRTLYECLCALLDDAMLRSQQRESALRLYEALFTYDTVYGGLVRHLEALASRAA